MKEAGNWTAIILAGSRPGETDFAHALGFRAKALIEIDGEPMLGRVAGALLASPSIGKLVVLAQQPEPLVEGALGWMKADPRVGLSASTDGISHSILAVAGSEAAPWPILVTTADHALLTPGMVEFFIARSGNTDASVGLVERDVVEGSYPETRRTWLKLSGGAYSGANLFALRTPAARKAVEIWSGIEKDRKKVLKLFRFFGPLLALRAATRTISLDSALRTAAKRIGITVAAVRLPFAEAAIDVDKPADLELVQRIVAGQKSRI